jgi:hypothetical protein
MTEAKHNTGNLADLLQRTWEQQAQDGFLLSDPHTVEIGTREVTDSGSGVRYRFRWMPHREIRGNIAELEKRGILNPNRDESKLFRDARDPHGRHCFLCAENIKECHPLETMVPLELAGQRYYAGANFAWIEPGHFTIFAAEHQDQAYSRHALEAMVELHTRTNGQFRVLFNGPGAGASIPWHLHYQITTAPMPIETLKPGSEDQYPTPVCRFELGSDGQGFERAHLAAEQWVRQNPEHHSLNVFIATIDVDPVLFIFPRDQRHATATGKGLVGGFEVAGDFVLSAPREEETFNNASVEIARSILEQITPPDWNACAAA